jgi:ribonuclease T2
MLLMSTGPTNSWTIHGLWPDHCDGTYDSNCDSSRDYSSITSILKDAGETALLTYMDTYWVSDDGTAESFWEHEWDKHGTCISTLETKCYTDYETGDEVVDFFSKVVELFKELPTYQVSSPLPYLHTPY